MKKLFLLILTFALTGACSFETSGAKNSEPTDTPTDRQEGEKLVDWPGKPLELSGRISEPLVLYNTTALPDQADYIVKGYGDLEAWSDLTIMPGVTIEFTEGVGIAVEREGSLYAVGTEEQPIVFTGKEKIPGFWNGILYGTTSENNRLSYAVVEYGGGDELNTSAPVALVALGGYNAEAKVVIDHCTFRHSAGHGLGGRPADLTGFSNNTFDDIALSPVTLHFAQARHLDAASTYLGSTLNGMHDVIELTGGSLSVAMTLKKLDAPYRFGPTSYAVTADILNIKAPLTIDPGVNIHMEEDTGFIVEEMGSLTAQGTTEEPIVFQGELNNGPWLGLGFLNTSANNLLDRVELDGGGGDDASFGSEGLFYPATVAVGAANDVYGKLTFTNSTITNSVGWGVYVYPDGDLTQSGNTFNNNASGDIN
ncbi:MAG: hypothetical protein IPJ88_04560 [Myxococcales bacterium]|nr:MAG: hypothetical protein IPJ88_04560 [Myxococcales bacterium]